MQILLNIVDGPLFEVPWIISEQPHASSRLFDRWLVTGPNGLLDVMCEQADETVRVSLGDGACFFTMASNCLTRGTVCNAMVNLDVAVAKHLVTDDAETAPLLERQKIAAFKTGTRSIDLPHDVCSLASTSEAVREWPLGGGFSR